MPTLDEAVDGVLGASSAPKLDPLAAAVAQTLRDDDVRVRQSLASTTDFSPDAAAQAARLGRARNLPPDVVLRNLPEVQRRQLIETGSTLLDGSPTLKRRVADRPDFTQQVSDEIDRMVELEAKVRQFGELKAYRGAEPQLLARDSMLRGIATTVPETLRAMREGLRLQMGDFFDMIGFLPRDEVTKREALRRAEQANARTTYNDPYFGEGLGADTASAIYGGLKSTAQQGLGIAASIATGSPAPGLAVLGLQQQTQAYSKYRARGASGGMASLGAAGEAAVEVGTELLPMGFLVDKLGKTGMREFMAGLLARELPTEQIATAVEDALDTAIANPDKSWGDYLAERPGAAYQTLVSTVTQSLVMGGANKVLERSLRAVNSVNEAGRDAEVLQALSALAARAKLRERNPEEFRTMLQDMVDDADGAPTEVRFDARTLVGENGTGGLLNQEELAQLPGIAAQLQEALTTGGEVVVPVADLLTVAPGTPLEQKLLEHARIGQNELSQFEAKEAAAQAETYLQAEAQRVMAQATDAVALQTSADTVKQTVLDQLNTAKRFTPDVNEAYATLVRDFYVAMSARAGMTPEELHAKYPLRVLGENPAAPGQVLNAGEQTTAPEFKNWFGDSNVVDAEGKPLVVYHGTTGDFSTFDRIDGGNAYGPGYYFTTDPAEASGYADGTGGGRIRPAGKAAPNVMPVYLSAKNVLTLDRTLTKAEIGKLEAASNSLNPGSWKKGELAKAFDRGYPPTARNVMQYIAEQVGGSNTELAQAASYDGLKGGYGYVVFRPEQIKSAIGNRGAFDPNDPSILNQKTQRPTIPGTGARFAIGLDFEAGAEAISVIEENASGESSASLEAQSRVAQEREQGRTRVLVDRDGSVRPLTGVDAVDQRARAGQVVLQRGVGAAEWTVLEQGEGVTKGSVARAIAKASSYAQGDMFAGDLASKTDTVPTGRLVSSKGETQLGGNVDSAGQQITATKQGLQNFWKWFGNSEATDGAAPLLLYHSTNSDVSAFETGRPTTNNYGFLGDVETSRAGIFLTPNADFSQEYLRTGAGQNVMPVYAKIENPLDLRKGLSETDEAALEAGGVSVRFINSMQNTWELFDDAAGAEFVAALQKAGYDGAILREASPSGETQGGDTYVAFKPEQIKSASGNRGTFDPNDPSIVRQGPRGTFNPNSLTISLLEKADLSTFLHETGHFFLEVMADVASQPDAPAAVAGDMQTLLQWFGINDLAKWNTLTLDQKRKHHERFAESFEQYLLEGKAPSVELQPLFQRFRSWLTSVYRSLAEFMRGRDLQLSDEVRAVFDRMLATDQQIQIAEDARGFSLLFKSAEQAGMTPEAWAAYQAQGAEATALAIDKLQSRSVKDMRWASNARSRALKALQKEAEGKRKGIEAEVAAEVAQQPLYRAIRWLRKGEMVTEDGEEVKAEKGFRLNTEALAEMYPATALGNPELDRLKGMTAANGLHPDMVAPLFGFDSGDALVRAVADAEPMSSVVEGMTDQRMLERFGDLATPQGLQRAADEAVHNEARGRFIATGLKALQEAGGKTERTPAGGSVNAMVRAAKQFADQLVARRKIRELKLGVHTMAEARAGRAAQAAMKTNDTKAAIVAQRDQLLQHYAARATMTAQNEVERGLAYLKKFDKESIRKKLPMEYVDQIDKLLERVDLRKQTNAAIDKRAKLAAWIKSQQDLGIEVELPDYLLEDAQLTSYRDLPVEAFRGLVETVKQIEHLGRLKSKLLTAKDQREFEAIRDEIVASVLANAGGRVADTRTPTSVLGKKLQAVKAFGAAHVKAATWARIFDGGKDGGPVWEFIIRPANAAADAETTMRAEATKALTEILTPWLKQGGVNRKTPAPSVGRSLSRQERLVIALNIGNEGNLQRLLGGEGWTPAQLKPVLDSLTPDDWKVVQAVWDFFEQRRPLVDQLEQRIFGKPLKKVEPGSEFTEAYKVRGGYYPIVYDPAASQRAEEHADAEQARQQLAGAYSAATVRRGFTKARAEEVLGRPLMYDLSGLYRGTNDQIHYLAWAEWLIDTNRLLRDKALDTAIRTTYGPEAVRQLKTWRDAAAEGDSRAQEAMDTTLGWLRRSVSVAGLGFNVMSALMQPLSFTQSITRVGAGWVGKGVLQYIGAPIAKTREVSGKSEFMANRTRTRFRELNELRNRVEQQTAIKRLLNEHAFAMMMRVQQMVDTPTWLGAYEKAIATGETEDRAVALADQAVIDSQGGGQTKDLAAIERGGPAQKLFTVFYTFMNTAANLGIASKMTPKSKAKFAADMLMLYTVPAVLGMFLRDALTPGDSGDEDEKLWKKLVAEQLGYLFGLFVVGREVGEAAKIVTGMADHPRDYQGPAGLRALADTYALAKQAGQGEFDDAFRKAVINLSGDLLGLPSAQLNRTITGAQALKEGKTKNPAALLFGYQEPR